MAGYRLKDKLRIHVLPILVGWVMRLWFCTVRTEILNQDIYEKILIDRNNGNIILGIWHRNIIFFSYFFRKTKNKLTLVSASRDGDIAAGMAPRFGYKPIRGSAYQKGTRALMALINEMRSSKKGCFCFTAIDGSRKPARIAERGMVFLAKKTGAMILPVSFSGTRLVTFHNAWDKTILPMPFSKVVVGFAPPIAVASELSDEDMERMRQKVEDSLNALTDSVDRLCGYTPSASASV